MIVKVVNSLPKDKKVYDITDVSRIFGLSKDITRELLKKEGIKSIMSDSGYYSRFDIEKLYRKVWCEEVCI